MKLGGKADGVFNGFSGDDAGGLKDKEVVRRDAKLAKKRTVERIEAGFLLVKVPVVADFFGFNSPFLFQRLLVKRVDNLVVDKGFSGWQVGQKFLDKTVG